MSSRFLTKLCWYRTRLAAMSVAEIVARAGDSARRQIDRRAGHRLVATPRDYGPLPEIAGLQDAVRGAEIDADLLAAWESEAKRARSGQHHLLNAEWPPVARGTMWHLDPVSQRTWPSATFTFAIDYRHAGDGVAGDIKYVWEVNRLQYLQPVAALACRTGDTDLARFCIDEIESWIDHNPPFRGVNWNSGIELALRVVSILITVTLVGAQASREQRAKIWATLHTHRRWIARYPSRFSSANNHRAAEGLGLFALGALCPHFAEAAVWRAEGWARLNDAAKRLIHPDGVGAEQSTAYLAALLETLLTGRMIARSVGMTVPDDYLRKVVLGAEYLRWLMDDKGEVPRIGDDDEACVIGPASHVSTASSLVGCVAAIAGRGDLAPPVYTPHLRNLLFGMPAAADFAPTGARLFAHGGMSVGRHRARDGDAIMLAFDHGPLGYLSIAAHGHADALALWLHRGGDPVLIDAGTYLYHADGGDGRLDRAAFRATAAHNTMAIGDAGASLMAGHFNWSHKAVARLMDFDTHAEGWHAEAEHDGYEARFGVRHRRRLNVTGATGAVIEESLIGSGTHDVALNFLFRPGLTLKPDGGSVQVIDGSRVVLTLHHTGGLNASISEAEDKDCGWVSPRFGVCVAAPRVVLRGRVTAGTVLRTALYWSV